MMQKWLSRISAAGVVAIVAATSSVSASDRLFIGATCKFKGLETESAVRERIERRKSRRTPYYGDMVSLELLERLRLNYVLGDFEALELDLNQFQSLAESIFDRNGVYLIANALAAADLIGRYDVIEQILDEIPSRRLISENLRSGRAFDGFIYSNRVFKSYFEARLAIQNDDYDSFVGNYSVIHKHIHYLRPIVDQVGDLDDVSDEIAAGYIEDLSKSEYLLARLFMEASHHRQWDEGALAKPLLEASIRPALRENCSSNLKVFLSHLVADVFEARPTPGEQATKYSDLQNALPVLASINAQWQSLQNPGKKEGR